MCVRLNNRNTRDNGTRAKQINCDGGLHDILHGSVHYRCWFTLCSTMPDLDDRCRYSYSGTPPSME
jgi:hypothetical protein